MKPLPLILGGLVLMAAGVAGSVVSLADTAPTLEIAVASLPPSPAPLAPLVLPHSQPFAPDNGGTAPGAVASPTNPLAEQGVASGGLPIVVSILENLTDETQSHAVVSGLSTPIVHVGQRIAGHVVVSITRDGGVRFDDGNTLAIGFQPQTSPAVPAIGQTLVPGGNLMPLSSPPPLPVTTAAPMAPSTYTSHPSIPAIFAQPHSTDSPAPAINFGGPPIVIPTP